MCGSADWILCVVVQVGERSVSANHAVRRFSEKHERSCRADCLTTLLRVELRREAGAVGSFATEVPSDILPLEFRSFRAAAAPRVPSLFRRRESVPAAILSAAVAHVWQASAIVATLSRQSERQGTRGSDVFSPPGSRGLQSSSRLTHHNCLYTCGACESFLRATWWRAPLKSGSSSKPREAS